MSVQAIIPKGALLSVTTGAYSAFNVSGVFRAVQDIDCDQIKNDFRVESPERKYDDTDKLLAKIITLGLIEPVDAFTWHMGGWDGFEGMSVEAPDGSYFDLGKEDQ